MAPSNEESDVNMGHHITETGQFQSDKHPDLPVDTVRISFRDPLARSALAALAVAYNNVDHEFSSDIRERLSTIGSGPVAPPPSDIGPFGRKRT